MIDKEPNWGRKIAIIGAIVAALQTCIVGLFIRYIEDMHQALTWRRIDMFDQMQLHTGNFLWKVQNETGGLNVSGVCSMEKIEMSGLSI